MQVAGRDPFTSDPVLVEFDEGIQHVDPLLAPLEDDAFVAPAFIDLQVNGFGGVDYCSPSVAQDRIAASIERLHATGVARLFPTVITGTSDAMRGALANLRAAKEGMPEGAAMEGFHVEGPYISPEDGPRGAHPRECVRPPDIDEFHRFQDAAGGHIRILTLSPEWPQATALIETATREGVVVSIGHTKATAERIADAVSAGATMSTHIGNGAHAILPRHPNYIWEQLAEQRLAAGFIVDGIHLGNAFLNVALRAKGVERSILVTDAVMPAGCEPGEYKLGQVAVELHADGSVRLKGGTRLAGSALTMDRAISNVMRFTGVSLSDAITMATRNPARVARVPSRQRGLQRGERADLVRFRFDAETKQMEVLETWVGGRRFAA